MRFRACALAALFAVALVPVGEAAAQSGSYQLRCMVGAGMSATITPGGSIRVKFRHGTTANRPRAGQCVWVDRAFNPGEPNTLIVVRNEKYALFLADIIVRGSVFSGLAAFNAQVYNNNAGGLVVTRVGN